MTTKIICDKCGKEIHAYNTDYNNIKFKRFVHERKAESYYGPQTIDKDLCDTCIEKLVEFLKESEEVK